MKKDIASIVYRGVLAICVLWFAGFLIAGLWCKYESHGNFGEMDYFLKDITEKEAAIEKNDYIDNCTTCTTKEADQNDLYRSRDFYNQCEKAWSDQMDLSNKYFKLCWLIPISVYGLWIVLSWVITGKFLLARRIKEQGF